MDLYTLTHTSYIEGTVNDNVNNKELAQFCIENGVRMGEDPKEGRFEDRRIPDNKEWDKVIANIQDQWKKSYDTDLNILSHWAAIHRKYEAANTHTHYDSNIPLFGTEPNVSGVYYVQVPKDAGVLMFDYDVHQHLQKRYWVEPVVGKFFLFPSWMRHFVTKNMSDDIRVSISFNAKAMNIPI